jgi:hypothetical protein
MHSSGITIAALALAAKATAIGVWATPHDKYSSSVGVPGCKINTDRVAYWPGSVGCNNICIKLSYEGRSVHLLRIDQSGGAYDISYDAWAYLQTGQPASANPITGGTVAMDYEEVDASECAGLINTPGNKLPLSASNSINYLASCLAEPSSWVAQNHILYNICDPICTVGFDEECHLDMAVSNQPSCPHTLGLTSKLDTAPVYDVEYQTGRTLIAGSGKVVGAQSKGAAGDSNGSGPAKNAPEAPEASSVPAGGVFVEYPTAPVPSATPAVYSTSVPTYAAPSSAELPPYPTTYAAAPSYSASQPAGTVYTMSTLTKPARQDTVAPTKPATVTVSAAQASRVPAAAALVAATIFFSVVGAFI